MPVTTATLPVRSKRLSLGAGFGIGSVVRGLCARSWSQNYFHQIRFAGVETLEPCGPLVERGDGGDQRLHLNRAGREEFDGLRDIRRRRRRSLAGESGGETTFCSGSVTSGEMLPTRVTVPPLRTQSMAAATVSLRPTASRTTSTPLPLVSLQDLRRRDRFWKIRTVGRAEFLGHFQAGVVDVGDEDARACRWRAELAG